MTARSRVALRDHLAQLFIVCVLLSVFTTLALAERVEQLRPTNYLNDFAGVVDSSTAAQINALALEVQQKANAQIAIVTIRTLDGAEASDFANRLFKQWGVGQKGNDRGVLVLLAVNDHKYWTEVGYGLEPILPDGKVGGFGREMIPLLRANRTSDAVLLITTRIARTIADDAHVTLSAQVPAVPEPSTNIRSEPGGPQIPIRLILLVLFILFFVLPAFLGRRRSGCVGCLFPFFFSRGGLGGGGYYGGGWGGGSSWGGGGFGGGSSGGGFGGFGGGSSGGGGAGGSW